MENTAASMSDPDSPPSYALSTGPIAFAKCVKNTTSRQWLAVVTMVGGNEGGNSANPNQLVPGRFSFQIMKKIYP